MIETLIQLEVSWVGNLAKYRLFGKEVGVLPCGRGDIVVIRPNAVMN